MDRKELIQLCRHYKGESIEPKFNDRNMAMLWFYERSWVELMMQESYLFDDEMRDYAAMGLIGFCDTDDVPITLKALLFNRYAKTAQSMSAAVEPFKDFYTKYYGA